MAFFYNDYVSQNQTHGKSGLISMKKIKHGNEHHIYAITLPPPLIHFAKILLDDGIKCVIVQKLPQILPK